MPTLYTRELPTMLRVADVAAYLNVSPRVAYKIVKQPGFPLVVLTNKCWRIPREAFLAWLEDEPATKELIEARAERASVGGRDA
jgi:excisionase family DNA binding protein